MDQLSPTLAPDPSRDHARNKHACRPRLGTACSEERTKFRRTGEDRRGPARGHEGREGHGPESDGARTSPERPRAEPARPQTPDSGLGAEERGPGSRRTGEAWPHEGHEGPRT